MTSDVLEMRYWLDIFIKALIGIVVGIVGYDYRTMKNSLTELEENKYALRMQVQAIEIQVKALHGTIERIDKKLDKVLDK
jgi:hypothetical protein